MLSNSHFLVIGLTLMRMLLSEMASQNPVIGKGFSTYFAYILFLIITIIIFKFIFTFHLDSALLKPFLIYGILGLPLLNNKFLGPWNFEQIFLCWSRMIQIVFIIYFLIIVIFSCFSYTITLDFQRSNSIKVAISII